MLAHSPITVLPKVGPKLVTALATLGIHTIKDLLQYFPSRYLDFSKFSQIKELRADEIVTVRGRIKTISSRFSFATHRMLSEAIVSDNSGSVKITWFNQAYAAKALKNGDEVLLSGKVDKYKNTLQLTNPIYEKVLDQPIHTGRLVPVYRLPETIFPKTFRSIVHAALPAAASLEDIIPYQVCKQFNLSSLVTAVSELHFPSDLHLVEKAHERLAFEENFVEQLAVAQHKLALKKLAAPSIQTNVAYVKSILNRLPFALTDDQKKALWAILQDLEHKHPMNRLLQGDVGSGKTVVALIAALQAIQQKHQVAILAPTEILAKQHFDSIHSLLGIAKQSRVNLALLTRNFHAVGQKELSRETVEKHIAQGKAQLTIGTHALLQDKVHFHSLALLVVDEQHRFGVAQRHGLLSQTAKTDKRANNKKAKSWVPHLLSMSATPIPRTAALAVYGDLDISTIDTLPQDRLPVKTWVVPEHKRPGAYDFVKKEIKAGRQAFIITPLVEESEKLQVKSAKTEFKRLQTEVFPDVALGLVYGSMKGKDKDAGMLAFKNKGTQILVATSVVEIGIDIPNATVMIIEAADRFGLAQLHQLRGRVGRGKHQSYCFLFSENENSQQRLALFASTSNGFALAEYDMKARGFGSLFGTSQTGFNFKYGQYLTLKVLEKAKSAAKDITDTDPDLQNYPKLKTLVAPLIEELHLE